MRRPYGNAESSERYDAWLKTFKMTYRSSGQCFHWLLNGRCSLSGCHNFGWMDHTSCYIDEGGYRVLLCQPYGVDVDDLISIHNVARELDLRVIIDGRGWYGHGTTTIWFRRNKDVVK